MFHLTRYSGAAPLLVEGRRTSPGARCRTSAGGGAGTGVVVGAGTGVVVGRVVVEAPGMVVMGTGLGEWLDAVGLASEWAAVGAGGTGQDVKKYKPMARGALKKKMGGMESDGVWLG